MIKALPMVRIGLPFLIASLIASFIKPTTIIIIIVLLSILCVVAVIFYALKRMLTLQICINIVIVFVAGIVGLSGVYIKTVFEQNRVLPLADNQYTVSGLVTNSFINDKGTYGYKITIDKVSDCKDIPKFKTILYSTADIGAEPYSYITANVTFNRLNNTSTFDTKSYYKQDGIYLLGFIDGELYEKENRQNNIGYSFVMLNTLLKQKVDEYFNADTSALLKAILLGDRTDVSDSLTHKLKLTGVLHITAISGLHTAIIAGALLWLLKRTRITSTACSIITIAAVWIFVALTGFNISTIRAGVMITLLLSAKVFGRKANALNSLFFAGILIVLQNPFAIIDIGFMMSFLATLGIVLCYSKIFSAIQNWVKFKNIILDFIIKSVSITLASTLFLIPIYLIYFNGISIISFVVNIIAVPIGTVILIAGLIFLCFSLTPIDIITELFSIIVQLFSNTFLLVTDITSKIPFAFAGIDKLWIKLMLLAVLAILIIIYKREKVLLKTSALLTANIMLVTIILNILININTVEITTFSSYSGQAIVLTYKQNATVVSLNSDSYINKSIVDFLDGANISSIDEYILLEANTKTVSDIKYLTEFKHVNNYILNEKNQVKMFIERYYPDIISTVDIAKLTETHLFGNIKASIIKADNQTDCAIQLNINGVMVGVAQNQKLLSSFKVENDVIYFADKKLTNFSEENTLENEIFNSKCVIIVGECDNDFESTNHIKFINAMDRPVFLKIKQNEEYKLTWL